GWEGREDSSRRTPGSRGRPPRAPELRRPPEADAGRPRAILRRGAGRPPHPRDAQLPHASPRRDRRGLETMTARTLQWGDVPTWLAAVGTIAAVVVALVFAGREGRHRREAAKRAQANQVTAWLG